VLLVVKMAVSKPYASDVVEKGLQYAESNWGLTRCKFLGSGQYGSVFLEMDVKKRRHAVKVSVKPIDERNQYIVEYLVRELEIHKSIRHRNVVRLFHGQSLPECTILDMEFCDRTLTDCICVIKGGKKVINPLMECDFRLIAKQLTNGICALHALGIVHRDIKPDNIMMCMNPDGSFTAKFADLGFAKKEADARTRLGSPMYEAPEVLSSTRLIPYTARCDFWSLGIVYYQLLTGVPPFPCSSVRDVYNAVCLGTTVAFSLPADTKVSDCCKHFVWRHLFRNADDRMCAEEAKKHPFVMPSVHIMRMEKTFNGEEIFNDVELGEIYFRNAQVKLGEKINEPHALSMFKPEPIVWGDVASVVGITTNESLDDMLIFTNGGVCCKRSTPVEWNNDNEDLLALIVSSKNGIVMNEMKTPDCMSLPAEDIALMSSKETDCNVTNLNKRLMVISNYIKSCRSTISLYEKMVQYCQFVGLFRKNVLNSDNLAKKLRDLQQDVCRKFDGFPKVGFCAPVSDCSLQFAGGNDGHVVLDSIRSECGKIHQSAQAKLAGKVSDLTEEFNQLSALWEQHKGYLDSCKKQLATATESWKAVIVPLRTDVEVMIRLSRYVDVLSRALEATDGTAVYRDLYPLVQCDYLRMSEGEMKLLERAVGREESAAGGGAKSDMEEYLDTLNEQLRLLRESYARLKHESDILRQQNDQIAATARKAFSAYSTMIEDLRAQLKEHGIPDPTIEDS